MKRRFWSKHYTARELGLPYKGLKKIYIGYCGAKSHSAMLGTTAERGQILAHTHVCKDDKQSYKAICVNDWLFLNRSVLLHELAHIRNIFDHTTCETHKEWKDGIKSDEDGAHGILFQAYLLQLEMEYL